MTKKEAINTWREQCLTARVVRSKTTFDPTIWQMFVIGHNGGTQTIKEMIIMKGDKFYWISVNYIQKQAHINGMVEYKPCNKTFELTEQEYNHLVSLFKP